MRYTLEDSINFAQDGIITFDEYFNELGDSLKWSTRLYRLLGITLTVLGLWLLFVPTIFILEQLPIVKLMLES